MAETFSPNRTTAQRRKPVAERLQSPLSPFFLGSNDDGLERAQARAARAAAVRFKSVAARAAHFQEPEPCLGKEQILELLQNCIKLARENKINQKNTWQLGLIDHLHEIIKVDETDDETNFQKSLHDAFVHQPAQRLLVESGQRLSGICDASCSLEAGVKIYSLRVDSVHSEAYKVLSGINRAGLDDESECIVEDGSVGLEHEGGHRQKDTNKKLSPVSTLESSFEALNVKKFDVAFAVDPLYHQTSAQFDEGGAKGLLLNNLGVFGKCAVLFDSMEVPGKGILCSPQQDKSETIDVSFAKEFAERMVTEMRMKYEISPTLRAIVSQFEEDNRKSTEAIPSLEDTGQEDTALPNDGEFGAEFTENGSNWDFHCYYDGDAGNEDSNVVDPTIPSHIEENENFAFQGHGSEDRSDEVEGYLFLSLGLNTKQNAWAGPDHWKYRKPKGVVEKEASENGLADTSEKPRSKTKVEAELDFTASLDKDWTHIFAPPKNTKTLLLPANRAPHDTKLPEDCHYQPEDLVKLFLLPKVMCLGRRWRKNTDGLRQPSDDYGPSTSRDGYDVCSEPFDDGNDHSDAEDGIDTLVSPPRQVNKIDVQYDKTSKQVDVQALKETLWDQTRKSFETATQEDKDGASFKQILASFPADCRAAAAGDISPHLCFICLLHLANEHGLTIKGCSGLEDLNIYPPRGTAPSD